MVDETLDTMYRKKNLGKTLESTIVGISTFKSTDQTPITEDIIGDIFYDDERSLINCEGVVDYLRTNYDFFLTIEKDPNETFEEVKAFLKDDIESSNGIIVPIIKGQIMKFNKRKLAHRFNITRVRDDGGAFSMLGFDESMNMVQRATKKEVRQFFDRLNKFKYHIRYICLNRNNDIVIDYESRDSYSLNTAVFSVNDYDEKKDLGRRWNK